MLLRECDESNYNGAVFHQVQIDLNLRTTIHLLDGQGKFDRFRLASSIPARHFWEDAK